MEVTHYLYLAIPPRETFVTDATAEEYAIMDRHFAYLHGLREAGKLLLAGPTLDGAYGVAILKVTEAERRRRWRKTIPPCAVGCLRRGRIRCRSAP